MKKTMNTKICLLYKTAEDWEKSRHYIPEKGEVCFCETENKDVFVKVGDGKKTFERLPWIRMEMGELMLYFGALDSPPQDTSEMEKVPGLIKQDLIDRDCKYTQTIPIKINPETEEGQYPAIAIDKRFKLAEWKQASAPSLPSNSFEAVDKKDYTLYYLTAPVTKDIEYLFNFEIGD